MEPTAQILFDVTQTISSQNPTMDYNSLDYIYENLVSISDFLQSILFIITSLLGTPGNLLVIWIAGFKMKTINAVWILHLAIADLICCVSLSIVGVGLIFYHIYSYSDLTQNLLLTGFIAVHINMCASVHFLTAMSVDRCISVIWPLWSKTHKTSKHVHITAAILWVLSLIIAVPHFYSFFYYFPQSPIKYTLVALSIFYFTIILTSYSLICFQLKKVKRPNKSQRPYRVITALIICFFICWGPYYIYQIQKNYFSETVYVIEDILFGLATFNSCINPIIYVFIGQDFKEIVMDSLPPGLRRRINNCCYQIPRKPESDNEVVCNTDV